MPLGERIKALQTEKGWSQGKLALQILVNLHGLRPLNPVRVARPCPHWPLRLEGVQDWTSLLYILDALLAKNRIKSFTQLLG